MLEKMGWSKGKGLGANEDGSTDFVRIRYKNDAQGLGFEERDDQWTQHDDSFNGLLQTLNEITEKKDVDNNIYMHPKRLGRSACEPMPFKATISGESLEEKSKRSRARVHYKKFTKCKDLTQYSEKDLANIFGKKAYKQEAKQIKTPRIDQDVSFQSSTLSAFESKKEKLNQDKVADIAKNERAKKKKNRNREAKSPDISELAEKNKKSKKRDGSKHSQVYINKNTNICYDVDCPPASAIELTKTKKKKKQPTTKSEKTNDLENTSIQIENRNSIYTPQNINNKTNDDIEVNLKYENVYEISKFGAEQFRFIDFNGFKGSNLADIKGYGIEDDVELKIVENPHDEKRILQLWSCTTDKYQDQSRPRSAYKEYQKQARSALRNHEKLPRFKMQQYRRKDAFKGLNI